MHKLIDYYGFNPDLINLLISNPIALPWSSAVDVFQIHFLAAECYQLLKLWIYLNFNNIA